MKRYVFLLSLLCSGSCVQGGGIKNLFPPGKLEEIPTAPQPMALDQRQALLQADVEARVASDNISKAMSLQAQQIDKLVEENNKLKVDIALRDVKIGDLTARLDFSVSSNANAGRDVNDKYISWILGIGLVLVVLSFPAGLLCYALAHRFNWFQNLKYGKHRNRRIVPE